MFLMGVADMKVTIGSDHGAVNLKEEIKKVLTEMKIEIDDVGTFGNEAVDYPDIAEKVADSVVNGRADKGIVLCGTGIGISIAANKIKGVRAALCHDVFSAKMSREHNDANILAMGERVIGVGPACEIVKAWLTSEFTGDRHARRVNKIMALEK
ncbi:MAG: ribose 5-phosphate isomerase [Massilibacillus sp.]|jgi:ribose 5-phosphate isomerase B|nr:ribose 5-phosphate isomerase [Massilibacillus sp.]